MQISKKTHRFIFIYCVIFVSFLAANIFIFLQIADINNTSTTQPTKRQVFKITSAQSRLFFMGTTFWGRNTNKVARASELGLDYPFAELESLNRDQYQAWIGNLECPVTDQDHTKYEEDELFVFNCHTDYLNNVAKYWTAFSLGTNHNDNWGDDGIAQTKQNLSAAGIQYFGHYRYDNNTENCGVISIPTLVNYEDGAIYEYQIPIGLCSASGVFGIPTEDALLNIKKYSDVLPTIVMPHMGVEYQTHSDELRTWLFRKIIDYGAEMVLADHPHYVQNTEAYNGKLIAYSMGNFMFDQQFSETIYSAAIDVTANFAADTDFAAWENLAILCRDQHGNCLDNIITSNLPRLEVTWSNYNFVPTSNAGNRQTRLANNSEADFIRKRLDWDNTVKNLK